MHHDDIFDLLESIEVLRARLYDLSKRLPIDDDEIIFISCEIDNLVNFYYTLTRQRRLE